ncbi:MAG: pyruvate kinase [Candidatus Paceibacterota bacterium]
MIADLIRAGVNIFRFNMKHNDIKWHRKQIKKVQKIADKLKTPIGIMIDLQGPEIRLKTKNKKNINVKEGMKITLGENTHSNDIAISKNTIFNIVKPGDSIFIDDGIVELKVIDKKGKTITAKVINNGIIKDQKTINIPEKNIDGPSLIKDDLTKLDRLTKSKVDFIALSFCRTKDDIQNLRGELKKRKIEANIVAKIETRESINNIDKIIKSADAIMVARGDLGLEIPIEEIAYWQRLIIEKCRISKKPVIVATQMLHSMTKNPRPTRAEVTDVANAVFNGTDAVMLSEETAAGHYPVKSVTEMAKILEFNEKKIEMVPPIKYQITNSTEFIISSAMSMINQKHNIKIDGIIILTETGYTARAVSSFRPNIKTIAVTDNQKTIEKLTLSYGIVSVKAPFPSGDFCSPEKIDPILKKLKNQGLIQKGEKVIVIHGRQFKKSGLTNTLSLIQIK